VEIIKCWEEPGETIPDPYQRHIQVMLAPDRRNCSEITYTHATIYPHSKTDYHFHDRPELIQILTGKGIAICNGEETPVEPDMALWVRAGESHQMINVGDEPLKLATVFIPAYTAEEILSKIREAAHQAKQGHSEK
jgi:mannose-6-phosphate isomerase-like protein (cupin superfamily)